MSSEVKGATHAKVSSKNQVTIPVAALREAGIGPGDLVEVEAEEGDRIVLRRLKSRFTGFIGALPELEDHIDIEGDRSSWADREGRLRFDDRGGA